MYATERLVCYKAILREAARKVSGRRWKTADTSGKAMRPVGVTIVRWFWRNDAEFANRLVSSSTCAASHPVVHTVPPAVGVSVAFQRVELDDSVAFGRIYLRLKSAVLESGRCLVVLAYFYLSFI